METVRGTAPPPARSLLLSAAALILVIAGLVLQWRRGNQSVGIDFYQFWIGGQAVREHRVSNLYSAEARRALANDGQRRGTLPDAGERLRIVTRLRSRLETFSTPFLYSAFALFGRNYETSYQLYRALSLLALCMSVLLLGRSARLPLRWSLVLLAFILFLYQPLQSEIRVTNVNAVQLLMLAAGISLLAGDRPERQVASGALFAIAAAFKPNVVLIAPLLVVGTWVRRDRRAAARYACGALLGAGSAIVISSLAFGSWRCWLQWRTAAGELASTILPRSAGNVAPLLPLIERFGPIVSAVAAASLIVVTIGAMARGRDWRTGDSRSAHLAAGTAVLIYLMTAGLVWLHYLLLALPPAIALLGRSEIRPARHAAAVRIATLVALSALAIDPWSYVLRLSRAIVAPAAATLGLAMLFVLSLAELVRDEA